jgi:hypothetical protein
VVVALGSVCLPAMAALHFLHWEQSCSLPRIVACLSAFLFVTAGHVDAHGP